jgi:uncharacterized protein YggE
MMFKGGDYARAVALLALLLAACRVETAAAEADPPLITVSGQAELSVVPDEVVFTLGVEKTDKDLAVAKAQNDASVRQILALARRFDVAAGDVKTDYISVTMRYSTDLAEELDENQQRKVRREFVGYEVSKTVIVRFTNIARFEEFFSEVLKAGVSSVRGVDFRTSQLRKHKDEARALAIRAAKEKAAALAREIGQSIGKAHSISEEGERGSVNSANYSTRIGGSFSEDEGSTIAPGTIKVTARVVVSFVLN